MKKILKSKTPWITAFFAGLPSIAFAKGEAIDPTSTIKTVINAFIGVGVGVATAYCAANAIFLVISYMAKHEGHDRAELKGKLQYLIILEILAVSIGGIVYWVKGLL
ncbi:hypothetical protein BIV60_12000 [Bacillus sp. MUM 116]|uniref:hypothetical protein n=1 Tax=Bacillus sp. MUM 116 TaxID=1678002 RepID=UPI0008F58A91|nr:hypothetical protein [Bacillus sp. MUM 116]OIK14270.1 hypothetical protein BIV60_12000 [Bacillus sp. MUM 116]